MTGEMPSFTISIPRLFYRSLQAQDWGIPHLFTTRVSKNVLSKRQGRPSAHNYGHYSTNGSSAPIEQPCAKLRITTCARDLYLAEKRYISRLAQSTNSPPRPVVAGVDEVVGFARLSGEALALCVRVSIGPSPF